MSRERVAALAGLMTVVLWASAFVGIRDAGAELTGGPLALGRTAVGALALGLFMVLRRERPPRWSWALAVCGVSWFGVYNVALNEAERRVDAGTAAMLVNVGPILIALIAGRVLREGYPRRLLTGCAVAFAGVVIIGLATSERGVTASLGTLLCLLAALTYAIGVVVQKPLLEADSPLAVTWAACTIGAVACLPYTPQLVSEVGDASPGALLWTVYLGVFPTAIAFTTWAFALRASTAGRTGAMTYAVPPLVIVMAWVLLDETPPVVAIGGGVLCLMGSWYARRPSGPRWRRAVPASQDPGPPPLAAERTPGRPPSR